MKITRVNTGTDQKSYFEDIELKFDAGQKILTDRFAAGDDGGFPLCAAGHRPRSASSATTPVSCHDVRLVGD